jgi:hypothetical protein
MSVLQRTVARTTRGLPDIVRHYVERNVPPAALNAPRVRFSEFGEMQLRPGRWSPFLAEQEMDADRVEFAWHANFRAAPLVSLRVRDWYRADAAGLDVRLWGVPVVRASNMELMQTLDDAWDGEDRDVFVQRHELDVVVQWPGNSPAHGIDDHLQESIEFWVTSPD